MTNSEQAQLADEWVQAPPKGWGVHRLKEFCEVAKAGVWGEDPLEDGTDVPVVRTADVLPIGVLNVQNAPLRRLSAVERLKALCRKDDLLVVKSSGSATNVISGKSAQVTDADGVLAFSNFLLRLRPYPEKADPRFVFYILQSDATRQRVLRMVSTTTYPNLKVPEYLSFPFLAPTPSHQKAIADFLDRKMAAIDALIERKRRLLDLLAEKRAALINQAVTKGLDPNVPMKDSGIPWIGEIPAHWEVKKLAWVLNDGPRNGVSPAVSNDGGGLRSFSLSVIRGGLVDVREDDVKYVMAPQSAATRFGIRQGDLLLVRGNGNIKLVGATGLVRGDELSGYVYPDLLMRMRCADTTSPEYLCHCINSAVVRPQLNAAARTTVGTFKVNNEQVRELRVLAPPRAEAAVIAELLDNRLDRQKAQSAAVNRQLARLQEYRQALITAAVTGQLAIPDPPSPATPPATRTTRRPTTHATPEEVA